MYKDMSVVLFLLQLKRRLAGGKFFPTYRMGNRPTGCDRVVIAGNGTPLFLISNSSEGDEGADFRGRLAVVK